VIETVYKIDRRSLAENPPYARWWGSKNNRVIPSKRALTSGEYEAALAHYKEIDAEIARLEAEENGLYTQIEKMTLALKVVQTEGPIRALRFHRSLEGMRADGTVLVVDELWEWRNQEGPPGEDLTAKSDRLYLLGWTPDDVYRPETPRERICTEAEAVQINRALEGEGQSERQLEGQIKVLTNKAHHIGGLLSDLGERSNAPLVMGA
jgi:hypothetical protein